MIIESPKHAESLVVAALGYLIYQTLQNHESERHNPSRTPDAMDFYIGATGARIKKLRELREQFENEMSMPLQERP